MTIKADINWTDDADAASALLATATWIQSMRSTPGVDRITVEAVVRVDGVPSPTAASAQIERIGRWLHEHDPDEFWTDDDTATSMIAAANRLRGTVRRFEHVLEAHDSDVFADFVAGNIDLPTAIDGVIDSYKAALPNAPTLKPEAEQIWQINCWLNKHAPELTSLLHTSVADDIIDYADRMIKELAAANAAIFDVETWLAQVSPSLIADVTSGTLTLRQGIAQAHNDAILALDNKNSELRDEIKLFRSQLAQCHTKLAATASLAEALQAEIADQKEVLAYSHSVRDAALTQVAELRHDLATANDERNAADGEVASLEAEVARLTTAYGDLETAHYNLNFEMAKTIRRSEGLDRELATLRHDLATANANNAALVTELSTCYAERDRLRSQLAKAGTE